jgi:hypothetical protein
MSKAVFPLPHMPLWNARGQLNLCLYVQENVGSVPQIREWALSTTAFLIQYSEHIL